jgi:hypothetical protein
MLAFSKFILSVCNLATTTPSYVFFKISQAFLDDSATLILVDIDSSTVLPISESALLSFLIIYFNDLLSSSLNVFN